MLAIVRHAGTLAPIIGLGGILLATVLDPTFVWTQDPLSNLGIRPGSRHVFNTSLVLAGGLAIVFAVGVTHDAEHFGERFIAMLFAFAAINLAGVGIFVIGHPLHVPAAVGFYMLVTLVFLVDGVYRRHELTGQITVGLALLQIGIWLAWIAGLWPGSGLAIPEFAGAMLLPIWIWVSGPRPTLRSAQSIAT